jgi:hypothetical protein
LWRRRVCSYPVFGKTLFLSSVFAGLQHLQMRGSGIYKTAVSMRDEHEEWEAKFGVRSHMWLCASDLSAPYSRATFGQHPIYRSVFAESFNTLSTKIKY